MKNYSILSATILVAFLTACATQRPVNTVAGPGTKRIYAASFDQTWRSAVAAARTHDFTIVTADRSRGYIEGRRTGYSRWRDENIGIWVRTLAPMQTEVEVTARQAGPPAVSLVDRQLQIQGELTANLTRETPVVGTAPGAVIIERGSGSSTIVVPERRETIIVPESLSTPEEQRRIEELRIKQEAGQRALANQVDETKREMLQRQVDRLREELRLQENRLRDLEQELR